jgi:hypothetical protein
VDQLNDSIDEMLNKIKNPEHKVWHGSQGMLPYIYESPDGGKTVYARPFGSNHTQKVLIRGDNNDQI